MGRTCGEPNEIELTAIGVQLNAPASRRWLCSAPASANSGAVYLHVKTEQRFGGQLKDDGAHAAKGQRGLIQSRGNGAHAVECSYKLG